MVEFQGNVRGFRGMCGGSNIRKRENESAQSVASASENSKNNVQLHPNTHISFHSLFDVVAKNVKKLHRNCRFREFQPGVYLPTFGLEWDSYWYEI